MSPILLLLRNHWQILLGIFIGATLAGVVGSDIYNARVAKLKDQKADALAAQAETLNAACAKDKQITTETSHGYQVQLADLADELTRIKRVQPNRCIPTVTRSAAGRDATPAHQELPRPDGVFTDDLYDFAADAEQVGRQLDACQGFITTVWAR